MFVRFISAAFALKIKDESKWEENYYFLSLSLEFDIIFHRFPSFTRSFLWISYFIAYEEKDQTIRSYMEKERRGKYLLVQQGSRGGGEKNELDKREVSYLRPCRFPPKGIASLYMPPKKGTLCIYCTRESVFIAQLNFKHFCSSTHRCYWIFPAVRKCETTTAELPPGNRPREGLLRRMSNLWAIGQLCRSPQKKILDALWWLLFDWHRQTWSALAQTPLCCRRYQWMKP